MKKNVEKLVYSEFRIGCWHVMNKMKDSLITWIQFEKYGYLRQKWRKRQRSWTTDRWTNEWSWRSWFRSDFSIKMTVPSDSDFDSWVKLRRIIIVVRPFAELSTFWCFSKIRKIRCRFTLKAIRMPHWCHTVKDGAKFWISYQQPVFLRNFSLRQLNQNLAPSTNIGKHRHHMVSMWHQNFDRK